MELPKFRQTAKLENKGILRVASIINNRFGWIFRELPKSDYGVDAEVELVENGQVLGRIFGAQIKSGNSHLKKIKGSSDFIYSGKIKHLNYWKGHTLPIVIFFDHPKTKKCYWLDVNSAKTKATKKTFTVVVPSKNILNLDFKHGIEKILDKRSQAEIKLDKLRLQRPFMDAILTRKNRVILEATEWINKSSGRGSVKLTVEDEAIILNWPLIIPGSTPYEKVFQQMFPWADFSIDEETYREYDENEFLQNDGIWDSEEGRYFYDKEDLEHYIYEQNKAGIRPYTVEQGELAKYRLILTVNDLGKAFLKIDNYLEGFNYGNY
jgi:hypothetical protein